MDKEKYIISKFDNKFIGDDAAYIGNYVYSKDIFLENTHFKKSWLTPYEVGKKAMLVNISDTIVMNAVPKYALIGLLVPKKMSLDEIKSLKKGIDEVSKKYNLEIIGGDTVGSQLLGVSVTIIGYTKKPIFRNLMKKGELLAFTGNLGGSLKGLKTLQNGGKLGKSSRFKNVVLREKFFYKTAKFINSAMDISDGLASDLPKFVRNKNIKFTKKLSKSQLTSGEEYEILFSFDKKHRTRVINEAKKARINLTIFGEIIDGKYNKQARSWHF
ncbi:MAG: thiamine-phosphate kinase [Campylobacteraceae bacterium]|nr:thiamine-phosphate kinase [Campylobacteraceae bacterium]